MQTTIRAAISKHGPFDGYVLNGVSLPGAFIDLFADLPSIWVAHNVEHVSARENAESADSALKRALFRRDARILEKLEHQLAEPRPLCLYAGRRRPRAARRRLALALRLRAVGDDGKQRRTIRWRATINYDAGLIGTWTWQPNRVGLEWFIREIAPKLPEGFKVAVAGSLPDGLPDCAVLHRICRARARCQGICPLLRRHSAGRARRHRRAVEDHRDIRTGPAVGGHQSSSLRGIDFRPDNCLVSDDPEDFCRQALTDLPRQQSRGACQIAGRLGISTPPSAARLTPPSPRASPHVNGCRHQTDGSMTRA